MLKYFAHPMLPGVLGTCGDSEACPAVDYKMIEEAFISDVPFERTGEASVYASGASKPNNQKHYRVYLLFCLPFYPL